VLRERARQEPDAPAYTFIDYELDPAGYPETLTWSQIYGRVQLVAAELASCGSPGDRAAVLAPQGLEYIAGVLGAMEAGFIAVPLSVPQFGAHDERVAAALSDSSPAAVLTTSAVVDDVVSCVHGLPGSASALIEIDALDLDTPADLRASNHPVHTKTALLQYTSGSTRRPTAVVVTHKNVIANLDQVIADYFEDNGKVPPVGLTMVSWLPFYHDMGLLLGILAPALRGFPAVLTSPTAFLQKPSRWIHMLAGSRSFSAAPNFAFELAVRRTSDDDMAGLDLGNVHTILSGSERIHAATISRFTERFSRFNLPDSALKPSYGLAEAMVYVASSNPGRPPRTVRFDLRKLSAGQAQRCETKGGTELVSIGAPRACTVRLVDRETRIEKPAGDVGEIWVHGDNVASGYWRNPQLSERAFGGWLVDPSPGTPQGPWLRTGDLGVMFDGELFITGRIKDLLIVDGRNHYPDDIEATIQEITGGRAVAISVQNDRSEELVAIVELKKRGSSDGEALERLHTVKQKVASAISKSHGLQVADLVLVSPGSIPITTSGKVRRAACAQRYQQDEFTRLDPPA
jgi:long chain fatty acid CoA FadD26